MTKDPRRRLTAFVLTLLAATAAAIAFSTASAPAQAPTPVVGVFPMAGTLTASPESQLSFRGVTPDQVGAITVTGSVTGVHTGHFENHSDGQGASFLPDKPFSAKGEVVTVQTALNVAGGTNGAYSFTVVARPNVGLQSGTTDPKLQQALTGQTGAVVQGDPTFKSRRDLKPPKITILTRADKTAPGYVFLAPKKVYGVDRPKVQNGAMIMDNNGSPLWFAPNNEGNITNFQVQTYQGQPVLTYWQGRAVSGTGEGEFQIIDSHYKPVKTVQGGNGYLLDFHESRLTPQGTLLTIAYNPVTMDLTPYGGVPNTRVVDAVVQEIDVATGLVEFEWHSIGNVPFSDSHDAVPKSNKDLYDYMHANSVGLTTDGDILVSGRELWEGIKLDRGTGAILAHYGGKSSDYKMGAGAQFAYQHDIEMQADGTLKVFDNGSAPKVHAETRGLILSVDDAARTITLKKAYTHTPALTAGTQGNTQALPNGDIFMEWGSQGYFTEFDPTGKTIFDGRIARGQDSYRGYRYPWVGTPDTVPSVGTAGRSAYVSWNGATQVARWKFQAGASASALTTVATVRRTGFETRATVPSTSKVIVVQALDAGGTVLATSKATSFKP